MTRPAGYGRVENHVVGAGFQEYIARAVGHHAAGHVPRVRGPFVDRQITAQLDHLDGAVVGRAKVREAFRERGRRRVEVDLLDADVARVVHRQADRLEDVNPLGRSGRQRRHGRVDRVVVVLRCVQ